MPVRAGRRSTRTALRRTFAGAAPDGAAYSSRPAWTRPIRNGHSPPQPTAVPTPLTTTASIRAHVAHAPLRRLSEAALTASDAAALLATFAGELRGALPIEGFEVMPGGQAPQGVAYVTATARTLALDEGRTVEELGEEAATRLAARTALLVPIAWAGDVRHVAVLARSTAQPWAPEEILLAETFANQAALGLARLEADTRRVAQAQRDGALARAAHALNVSLELQAVLDTLVREASLAVGAVVAGVYLSDDDGTALATAGHNRPPEWFGYRLEPGEGIAGQVLTTGRPVALGAGVGVAACAARNGELRGALSLGFADERDLHPDDLHVLEAIADLAVVACHNAEAYDDVRTAASTDALTGLLNHGAMQVRVREEIARAARDRLPLSLRADRPRQLQARQRRARPSGRRRAAAPRRRRAARRGAPVRPGRPLRRRRVRAHPPRHRGAGGPRRRRTRPRARAAPARRGPRTGRAGAARSASSAWEATMGADELLAAADRALLLAKRTGKGRVAVAEPGRRGGAGPAAGADVSPAAVHALAAAIDARDSRTAGHAEQVVRLASGVAMLLGLTADAVERVGHGALLHDVGKLGIPPEILRRTACSTTPSGTSWPSIP